MSCDAACDSGGISCDLSCDSSCDESCDTLTSCDDCGNTCANVTDAPACSVSNSTADECCTCSEACASGSNVMLPAECPVTRGQILKAAEASMASVVGIVIGAAVAGLVVVAYCSKARTPAGGKVVITANAA